MIMHRTLFFARQVHQSQKARQAIVLYGSMTLYTLLGFIISIVNTRLLGKEGYGDYKFLEYIFLFGSSIFTFGFFTTGCTLIAKTNNRQTERCIIAATMMVALFLSVVLCLLLFCFSFFIDSLFDSNTGYLLVWLFPIGGILIFRTAMENILTGSNRIYMLSILRALPMLIYLAAIFTVTRFFAVTTGDALLIRYLSLLFTILFAIIFLRPALRNFSDHLHQLWAFNKSYGMQLYWGVVASIATTYLGAILIGFFVDNVSVGYFGIAITVTMPLTLIPGVIGTTLFKSFASAQKISAKANTITLALSCMSLLGYWLAIKYLFLLFYPDDFRGALPLVYILSIGCFIHGLGDFYLAFLKSHGKGREIRSIFFVICCVNLLGYTLLGYFYNAPGAAVTRVLSSSAYFLFIFIFYKKMTSAATQ